jgi:hypothetical protein
LTEDKDPKFQKELAYFQIGATLFATVGSVLIAMGISIFIFSEGINLDAADKKGETYQFFQQLQKNEDVEGKIFMISGAVVLIGGTSVFAYFIRRLK